MKFSIKDFFSKCDQILSFLRIWLLLLKKSFLDNIIFCAVIEVNYFAQIRLILEAKFGDNPLVTTFTGPAVSKALH